MTMLELIDGLVEVLRGQEMEGVGPIRVEKYRRIGRPGGPVVYVSPVAQSEAPVAIGGQFAEQLDVELRCEAQWDGESGERGDVLLRAVDRILSVLEGHREINGAKRGRIGRVEYRVEQVQGGVRLVAVIPVSFSADK